MGQQQKKRYEARILLSLLLLLAGCGRAVNGTVEKRIRERLPEVMGSARQFRVHIANAADRTLRGRFSDVQIDADDLSLPNSLVLDNLHLVLRGVEVDSRRGVLRQIREAHFTITVGVNSLDEYFAGEAPDGVTLRNVRFAFHDGLVTLTGERVAQETVAFSIEGKVRLGDAGQLTLDTEHGHITGLKPDDAISTFLSRRFENAVALSTLPFPVHLSRVEAEHDRLILTGSADTAAILERARGEAP